MAQSCGMASQSHTEKSKYKIDQAEKYPGKYEFVSSQLLWTGMRKKIIVQ